MELLARPRLESCRLAVSTRCATSARRRVPLPATLGTMQCRNHACVGLHLFGAKAACTVRACCSTFGAVKSAWNRPFDGYGAGLNSMLA